MQLYCTRPGCSRPTNSFPDLDDVGALKTVQQKFCTHCGMPLILVGRYLPTQLLGQGGFGAAFLGRDRYTPGLRQCVIKQFQPSGTLNPAQLKVAQDLFEREAEVLEELGREHPQIPDLFAFFELAVPKGAGVADDRFFYLVQEFIDGETIEAELLQNGAFSESAVREVLTEILKVLQFVHENGSIHRDIKPSNIMRHRNGRLYLLDFGAVKAATKAASQSNSTGIYSLGYAPPEQMAGGQVYPSTDLYALAVTGVMLLTGKPPNELFDAYSNQWQWHSYANPSRSLRDVLDRMLLATPSQRFQSAQEALEALANTSGTVKPATPTPKSAPSPGPVTIAPSPAAPTPALPSPVQPAPKPQAAKPQAAVQRSHLVPKFSTFEFLGSAAFTGFEGGLMAIALVSLLGTTLVSAGFWLLFVVVLGVAQRLRAIEKFDLPILAGLTIGVVGFFSQLHKAAAIVALGNSFLNVLVIAVGAGLALLAIALVFRLIYGIVSTFL